VAEGLADGPHEVVVTVTGRTSARSADSYVQIVDIAAIDERKEQ
jgi:hypothetical protein